MNTIITVFNIIGIVTIIGIVATVVAMIATFVESLKRFDANTTATSEPKEVTNPLVRLIMSDCAIGVASVEGFYFVGQKDEVMAIAKSFAMSFDINQIDASGVDFAWEMFTDISSAIACFKKYQRDPFSLMPEFYSVYIFNDGCELRPGQWGVYGYEQRRVSDDKVIGFTVAAPYSDHEEDELSARFNWGLQEDGTYNE